MKILITGSNGFVGKTLSMTLNNLKNSQDKSDIVIDNVFECDVHTTDVELDSYCKQADFVFHFAGTNRASAFQEYYDGNVAFLQKLLSNLEKHDNYCPIMFASSTLVTKNSTRHKDYIQTKKIAEDMLFDFATKHQSKVYVYRLNNLFGAGIKPNYNSVVANFCYNISRQEPIKIDDGQAQITLVYIQDFIDEMMELLKGKIEPTKNNLYRIKKHKRITIEKLAQTIEQFYQKVSNPFLQIPKDKFERKLFNTFLYYLPLNRLESKYLTHFDSRGSFTEILKDCGGQTSVNVINLQQSKGNHYHTNKIEICIVLQGQVQVELVDMYSLTKQTFVATNDSFKRIILAPYHKHKFTNVGDGVAILIFWSSECFDANNTDTFWGEKV